MLKTRPRYRATPGRRTTSPEVLVTLRRDARKYCRLPDMQISPCAAPVCAGIEAERGFLSRRCGTNRAMSKVLVAAWHCEKCEYVFLSDAPPKRCPRCKARTWNASERERYEPYVEDEEW